MGKARQGRGGASSAVRAQRARTHAHAQHLAAGYVVAMLALSALVGFFDSAPFALLGTYTAWLYLRFFHVGADGVRCARHQQQRGSSCPPRLGGVPTCASHPVCCAPAQQGGRVRGLCVRILFPTANAARREPAGDGVCQTHAAPAGRASNQRHQPGPSCAGLCARRRGAAGERRGRRDAPQVRLWGRAGGGGRWSNQCRGWVLTPQRPSTCAPA